MDDRHIYRGKRIGIHAGDNGEWAFGCNSYSGDGKNTIDVINYLDQYEEMHVIDPDTLGQCTGLPDCNKKLIFEGDGVRLPETGSLAYVEWGATEDLNRDPAVCDAWVLHWLSGRARAKFRTDLGYWADKVIVAGNIHDNPELLREGENNEV